MIEDHSATRTYVREIEPQDNVVRSVYSDIITFLMALFVILTALALNRNDADFLDQMRIIFGGKVIEQMEYANSEDTLVTNLKTFIQDRGLEKVSRILIDEYRVKLILNQPVLYDSGRASLKPGARSILRQLMPIFKEMDNNIMIEGHTDNIPIQTRQFINNWELSFHRALTVLRFFILEGDIHPARVSITGYGEFKPIASNTTPKGRAQNRRIEISILRHRKTREEPDRKKTEASSDQVRLLNLREDT